MLLLSRKLVFCFALPVLLAGCATGDSGGLIYGTPGRIVAIEPAAPGSSDPAAKAPATSIYTLRTRVGEELRTSSRLAFAPGDCVILWHGLRTFVQPGDPFNYMSGDLRSYDACVDKTASQAPPPE